MDKEINQKRTRHYRNRNMNENEWNFSDDWYYKQEEFRILLCIIG